MIYLLICVFRNSLDALHFASHVTNIRNLHLPYRLILDPSPTPDLGNSVPNQVSRGLSSLKVSRFLLYR